MLSLLVEQDVSQKFVLLCFNIEHIQWTNTDLPHNCSGIMSSLHFVFLKKKKKKRAELLILTMIKIIKNDLEVPWNHICRVKQKLSLFSFLRSVFTRTVVPFVCMFMKPEILATGT